MTPYTTLAALYALCGRDDEAAARLETARGMEPGLSLALMAKVYGANASRPGSRSARLIDALRGLGLPEG